MANVDLEVGVGPINKTNWWPLRNKSSVEILLDCKEQGHKLYMKPSPSIYMVRSNDQNQNSLLFTPQVVSIGPLHREDATLKPFEEKKKSHLYHLLEQLNNKAGSILNKCLERVNDSIDAIRGCYGETIIYTDEELATMMVMDACFILDFLFLEEHLRLKSRNAILTQAIYRDLVLLENQIPFFVLQNIYDCTVSQIRTTSSLTSSLFNQLKILIPFKDIKENNHAINIDPPRHILGLLQMYFYPIPRIQSTCPPLEEPNSRSEVPNPLLEVPNHSALELDKAGVKFKPYSKEKDGHNRWALGIDFGAATVHESFRWCWGDRTLKMPAMCIDDNTEIFLRNVIAYEQCTPDVPDYVTSYVSAIDMLIDTKEDLSKLVDSKVLTNHLGSNKAATKMLNEISKQFVFEEFYYKEEWSRLHKYYDSYVPRNIALLKRTHFSSPWTIIALFAGVVVFTFTIVQGILRIMKY